MMPAGCSTGSTVRGKHSSAAATPTRPPVVVSARPPTWSRPSACWTSTAGSGASTPAPWASKGARPPPRASWSPLCPPTHNPHNPHNLVRQQVLWVVRVLSCVATPRGAAHEGQGGCHVIQRERPQPLPAISGAAPGHQRPPTAYLYA